MFHCSHLQVDYILLYDLLKLQIKLIENTIHRLAFKVNLTPGLLWNSWPLGYIMLFTVALLTIQPVFNLRKKLMQQGNDRIEEGQSG